ncbi:YrzI family small protein [Evansella sp. LMS18]|uniref:YrzI family small protein n=1 Tax=Evansella sp. LMS18 TaxID=2924033 RepID=UPI0020D0EC06|nr:YrzI family small protein [Evansella sp. LMS18]UTR11216.1 YrzI family small protein [Evansella sp. LMS18]
MAFNLFFLTITVTRRKTDQKEVERAHLYQESVKHREAVRARQANYLNRLM